MITQKDRVPVKLMKPKNIKILKGVEIISFLPANSR